MSTEVYLLLFIKYVGTYINAYLFRQNHTTAAFLKVNYN